MSREANRSYRGVIRNGSVVLGKDCDLPEGTPVEVRAEPAPRGTPRAIAAAARAAPHVEEAAVEELMRKIEEGRRPVRFGSTLD